MNIPKNIKTYCPKCKKHTEHKIKKLDQQHGPSKKRKTSKGQIRHEKKTHGYTSKLATKKERVKQASRNVAMLECSECKKKRPRTITQRTRKKSEFKRD